MDLKLNEQERELALAALSAYYFELQRQLEDTDRCDLALYLRENEVVLARIIDRLEQGWAARHGCGPPAAL